MVVLLGSHRNREVALGVIIVCIEMKPVRTCASQRRFRHLNSVLCRSLPSPPPEVDTLSSTYFCIYRGQVDTPDQSLLIYQSEVAEGTQNPTWTPIEQTKAMLESLLRDTVFTIMVHDIDTETVVWQTTFDMRYVQYCCTMSTLKERQFHQPTILLETVDGLFLPGGLANQDQEEDDSELVVPAGKDTTQMCVGDLKVQGFRMAQIAYAVQEAEADTQAIKKRILELVQRRHGIHEKQAKCLACKHRIENLNEQVLRRKQELLNEQHELMKQRQSFRMQVESLNEAKKDLETRKAQTRFMETEVDRESLTSSRELAKCIEARRRHLLRGVSQIYPIEADKRGPGRGDKTDKADKQTIARCSVLH